MKNPDVSVIIPAYNCSAYIDKAICSVMFQEVPLEIIVVDDHSSDNLEETLISADLMAKIHYIRNPRNRGVAETRNIGVKAAKGKYIAYLDADDWWRKGKLKTQLSLMNDKKCVLTYTARELVDENGHPLKKVIGVKEKIKYEQLLYHNIIPCSSVVMEREAALEFPMRRSDLHEDYLQWLNILKKYHVAYGINKPMLISRMTEQGKSRKKWKSIYMTYGVYREMKIDPIRSVWYMAWHLGNGVVKYARKGGRIQK